MSSITSNSKLGYTTTVKDQVEEIEVSSIPIHRIALNISRKPSRARKNNTISYTSKSVNSKKTQEHHSANSTRKSQKGLIISLICSRTIPAIKIRNLIILNSKTPLCNPNMINSTNSPTQSAPEPKK